MHVDRTPADSDYAACAYMLVHIVASRILRRRRMQRYAAPLLEELYAKRMQLRRQMHIRQRMLVLMHGLVPWPMRRERMPSNATVLLEEVQPVTMQIGEQVHGRRRVRGRVQLELGLRRQQRLHHRHVQQPIIVLFNMQPQQCRFRHELRHMQAVRRLGRMHKLAERHGVRRLQ
jgi:hypothetical protein